MRSTASRPLALTVAMWASRFRISISGGQLDVAGGDVGRAADVEADHDRLLGAGREHDVLQVQDDVGDVLGDAGDGVELVEGVVEAHRGDGCARDRRQQGAPQGVADGVAEAGLERTDGELLAVPFGLARRFDGGTLDDEHAGCSSRSWWAVCGRLEVRLLGVELDDELLADGHVDVGALGQVADRDLLPPSLASSQPTTERSSTSMLCRMTIISLAFRPSETTWPWRTR